MRCAIPLFVTLLVAPVALFWGALISPTETPGASFSVPQPDPDLVRQFVALCEEYQQARSDYDRDLTAAGLDAKDKAVAENDLDLKFFRRFMELAEQHRGDPLCPQIVQYAMAHCVGVPSTPEEQLRIKTLLEQYHGRVPCGIS
jgi:hypothetical protein